MRCYVSDDAAHSLKDVIMRLREADQSFFSDQYMPVHLLEIIEQQPLVSPNIQFDDESAEQFVEALAMAYVRSEWFLNHSTNHGFLGSVPVDDDHVRLTKIRVTISMRRYMGWDSGIKGFGA